MNFAGKVVFITGGSSGIGAATAMKFAQLGAALALNDRNGENLQEVAKKCAAVSKAAPPAHLVVGDIANEPQTECVWQETIKKYNKLDVLINNAGILETGSIENTSLEQYDRVMNTNLIFLKYRYLSTNCMNDI